MMKKHKQCRFTPGMGTSLPGMPHRLTPSRGVRRATGLRVQANVSRRLYDAAIQILLWGNL